MQRARSSDSIVFPSSKIELVCGAGLRLAPSAPSSSFGIASSTELLFSAYNLCEHCRCREPLRMSRKRIISLALLALAASFLPFLPGAAVGTQRGADIPWTTYEAEEMTNSSGSIIGPQYQGNLVAAEASGRKCVRLNAAG